MKQVININFQGRVVPIEVTAYDILKQYIDSLVRHFAAEEGKDEIINDIENRIGELFQERIKAGSTCITDEDVNAIIRSIGRPEDFESEAGTGAAQEQPGNFSGAQSATFAPQMRRRFYRDENNKWLGGVCSGLANYFNIDVSIVRVACLILSFTFGFGVIAYIVIWIAVPSTAAAQIGSLRKRLYRDTDDKVIGGVCSGLAHYFGINVWIPRLLFLIPFLTFVGRWSHWAHLGDFPNIVSLSFSPGSMIFYIILWLVLPEAVTTAEKLEMKGEKVDMNSIKNSVIEEIKGVQERAQKFSKEATAFASERGKTFGAEAAGAARRGGKSFGDVIIFLVKLFGYFILGSICFALIVALFVGGFWAIGFFPLKDFVLAGNTQNLLAWGTLVFFILVPMIGVITWIVRRIARIKRGSKMLRFGFSALWIAGWFCVIFLLVGLARDFRHSSQLIEQNVVMSNPAVNSLEITTVAPGQRYSRNNFLNFNPFEMADEDTAFIRNTEVQLSRAAGDSFYVTVTKVAAGPQQNYADSLASMISYRVQQQDSMLVIDKAIAINKTEKFRNQRVILTVYVPVGKKIFVNENVGWSNQIRFDGPWRDGEMVFLDNIEHNWNEGVWYIMTANGLNDLKGKPADFYKREQKNEQDDANDDDDDNRANVKSGDVKNGADSSGYRYDKVTPRDHLDSLKFNLQQEEKKYRDSLKKEQEKIENLLNRNRAGGTAFTKTFAGHDPTIFLN